MNSLYLAPLTPEWRARLNATYGRLTPKQLATEIVALHGEKAHASRFDPATRQEVVGLANERTRLAVAEVQRRVTDGRA